MRYFKLYRTANATYSRNLYWKKKASPMPITVIIRIKCINYSWNLSNIAKFSQYSQPNHVHQGSEANKPKTCSLFAPSPRNGANIDSIPLHSFRTQFSISILTGSEGEKFYSLKCTSASSPRAVFIPKSKKKRRKSPIQTRMWISKGSVSIIRMAYAHTL